MKAILEFDLDNEDDRKAHLRCVKSTDMAIAIWTVLRNNKHLNEAQIVEKMYERLGELNIDELID